MSLWNSVVFMVCLRLVRTGVVGGCTNVEVRQCGWSGVSANNGASISLIGAKTTVHHNCTKGARGKYGLKVSYSSSTIQLVSHLTKEQVSLDNVGGGNWGAYKADTNQIKTISQFQKIKKIKQEDIVVPDNFKY